jgi:hypothetical protein
MSEYVFEKPNRKGRKESAKKCKDSYFPLGGSLRPALRTLRLLLLSSDQKLD